MFIIGAGFKINFITTKFVWDFTHWFVGEGSCPGFSGGRVRRRGLHRDGCWRGSGIPIDVWLCLLFFLLSFIMPLKCCNILIYFEKTPSNNQTGLCNKFCIWKGVSLNSDPKGTLSFNCWERVQWHKYIHVTKKKCSFVSVNPPMFYKIIKHWVWFRIVHDYLLALSLLFSEREKPAAQYNKQVQLSIIFHPSFDRDQ